MMCQNDVVTTQCREKTAHCQYDTVPQNVVVSTRLRVKTTSCKKKKCRIKMVLRQHGVVPTQHRVNRASSRKELMSARRRVKTASCQFEIVSICMFSNRCSVNTTPCQDGIVPRRHRATTTLCQHDVVPRRSRARNVAV